MLEKYVFGNFKVMWAHRYSLRSKMIVPFVFFLRSKMIVPFGLENAFCSLWQGVKTSKFALKGYFGCWFHFWSQIWLLEIFSNWFWAPKLKNRYTSVFPKDFRGEMAFKLTERGVLSGMGTSFKPLAKKNSKEIVLSGLLRWRPFDEIAERADGVKTTISVLGQLSFFEVYDVNFNFRQ